MNESRLIQFGLIYTALNKIETMPLLESLQLETVTHRRLSAGTGRGMSDKGKVMTAEEEEGGNLSLLMTFK